MWRLVWWLGFGAAFGPAAVAQDLGAVAGGRIVATAREPLPATDEIYVRTADRSELAVRIRLMVEQALAERGYRTALGAPLTFSFRTAGAFGSPGSGQSLIQLRGRAGSGSGPTGSISLTLPSADEPGPARHRYQLELEIYDDTGRPLWTAQATLVTPQRDPLAAARRLVPQVLEYLGRTADAPLAP